jgi:hypothetical protein
MIIAFGVAIILHLETNIDALLELAKGIDAVGVGSMGLSIPVLVGYNPWEDG